MIKGISKQIIEIKCPENEHFEKVLLFVNNKNPTFSTDYLQMQAKQFSEKLIGRCGRKRKNHKLALQLFGLIFSSLVLVLTIIALCTL